MLYSFEPSFLQKPCDFLNLSPKVSEFDDFVWGLKEGGCR